MRVEIKDLSKHFGPTKAVEHFTVTLEDGELVACWALGLRQEHGAEHALRHTAGHQRHHPL